jgi:hypothetical protein
VIHIFKKKEINMYTNTTNPVIIRLLDVQNQDSYELRKIVHEEARLAKKNALAEVENIKREGERKAAEMLAIGEALVDKGEISALETEKQTLQRKREEDSKLAVLTDVAKLKMAFLVKVESAEGEILLITEKIEQLKKPEEEAKKAAEQILAEADQAARKVIAKAEELPAMKTYEEVVKGLRAYFLRMVESGKTSEAVDLAGKEANMALYQEIKLAARIKNERFKAARKVFVEGIPSQVEIPTNAAARVLVRDLIIVTTGKGQEVARLAVDEMGGVTRQETRKRAIWKLAGMNNVIPLQPKAVPASA